MLQPRLIGVQPAANHTLILRYENGKEKTFDVAPYISGDWYSQLRDTAYFAAVRLIPNGAGIEWPNGQDIAPHELYDLGIDAANERSNEPPEDFVPLESIR
jgi:hypothetical protein